ncbi:MAG: M23 family metallopeptidase [Treponema sp.]|nr:M23 family metallopeptidase [Treponema sp.]
MKKLSICIALVCICIHINAFEWPVQNVQSESIKSSFGQKRGTTISSSIIIESLPPKGEEEEFIPEVYSCDEGRILIKISDLDDDNDFFPSTLGQALIISHSDNIISIYGNLNHTPDNSFENSEKISKQTKLGTIAKTAWATTKDCLEFQLIDIKRSLAMNPRTILPRLEKEKSFPPVEIIVENKDGKRLDLNTNRAFLSGNYRFYQRRNELLVPQKSSISINGELVDEINFNEIYQKDNSVFILSTNKKLNTIDIYPDDKLLLLGEVRIQKGKSVITFENTSPLEEKRLVNYAVNIY